MPPTPAPVPPTPAPAQAWQAHLRSLKGPLERVKAEFKRVAHAEAYATDLGEKVIDWAGNSNLEWPGTLSVVLHSAGSVRLPPSLGGVVQLNAHELVGLEC